MQLTVSSRVKIVATIVCEMTHIYCECNNVAVGPDVKGGSVVLPDPRPGSAAEHPYAGTSPIGGAPIGGGAFVLSDGLTAPDQLDHGAGELGQLKCQDSRVLPDVRFSSA